MTEERKAEILAELQETEKREARELSQERLLASYEQRLAAAPIQTFDKIVADSKKTRHLVYGLRFGKDTLWASKPKGEKKDTSEELQGLRNEERRERASQLAKLVERIGLERCEDEDINIGKLLSPPIHVQEADGDLPVLLSLIPSL